MNEQFLRSAVQLARDNIEVGGRPFGAVVVKDDNVIATGVNRIIETRDPTSHGAKATRAIVTRGHIAREDLHVTFACRRRSTAVSATGSTGLLRCSEKPAALVRLMSSAWLQPVSATSLMSGWRARTRRATS